MKADYLAGSFDMLLSLISAILRTHPDLASLEKAFSETASRQQANALPLTVPEQYLQGMQDTQKRIEQLIYAAKLEKSASD